MSAVPPPQTLAPLRREAAGQRGQALRRLRLQHGAVALFSAAVVLLIALSAWWLYFLSAAIEREEQLTLELLSRDVELAAIGLAHAATSHGEPVPTGALASDNRLEVVANTAPAMPDAVPTQEAKQTGLRVQPTAAYLQALADAKRRRQLMIAGEGALLTSLLVAVVAMLYRLMAAERRFRTEMQEFLGRVTHEMKTPLAGIKAVLQTLASTTLPPDQAREVTVLALREVEREEHLIQNLLLAQRLRLPDHHLHSEVVELAPLLQRFVHHRQETLGTTVQFALQCPPEAQVLGDPTALWTILENLGDNAIKYGGQVLQFVVSKGVDHWQIAVCDDGIGFESHAAEAIFAAFERQSGQAAARHGTGLGLHIARSLAQQMAGHLTAQSAGAGQGATFVLVLPAAPATAT